MPAATSNAPIPVSPAPEAAIQSIAWRRVLNSHVQFTFEFTVILADGSVGVGSSPKGETVGIYEDKEKEDLRGVGAKPGSGSSVCTLSSAEALVRRIGNSGLFDKPLTQAAFDGFLAEHVKEFGQNLLFGLSLAFFNALSASNDLRTLFPRAPRALRPPAIFLNILNGGQHAYTNPVLSDFPEFMLVARSRNVPDLIEQHQAIQRHVKEELSGMNRTVIAGNPVHTGASPDNRQWLDLLSRITAQLGLSGAYDLMIDASAGDLASPSGYKFNVTRGTTRSSDQMINYWLDLIRNHGLRFLEDPLSETDYAAWAALTRAAGPCRIIGDNLYCSDWRRIEEGAAAGWAHGVILKPNQAGTVTAICKAAESAQRTGHIGIASHRSISTEETFLSTLTVMSGLPYIKIGPLFTDYSSVVRLNAILRLAGDGSSAPEKEIA